MAKYIQLDAVVAEIKRLKDRAYELYGCSQFNTAYNNVLKSINTLEVKEVDLDYIKNELDEVVRIYKPDGDFGWGTLYNVATHFYELGLRASQSTVPVYGIEEALKENGIDPDSKEANMYREAIYKIYDRLKAQKGEKI